jgi:hypothetical protein
LEPPPLKTPAAASTIKTTATPATPAPTIVARVLGRFVSDTNLVDMTVVSFFRAKEPWSG